MNIEVKLDRLTITSPLRWGCNELFVPSVASCFEIYPFISAMDGFIMANPERLREQSSIRGTHNIYKNFIG